MVAIAVLLLARQTAPAKAPPNPYEIMRAYCRSAVPRGPFHNPWIWPSGGGGYGDGKNPTVWHYSLPLGDATATADIDATTGAVSNFHCDWPPAPPAVAPEQQPLVDKALKLIQGVTLAPPLILRTVEPRQVEGSSALYVLFIDQDDYKYPVYLRRTDGRRLYTEPELANKWGEELLGRLGVQGPLRRAQLPDPDWGKSPAHPKWVTLIDRSGQRYSIYLDESGLQVRGIESVDWGRVIANDAYKPTQDDVRAGEQAMSLFGHRHYVLTGATRRGNAICFEYRFSPSTRPYAVRESAELLLDRVSRRLIEYRGPTSDQIRAAESTPPIDPKYLATFDSLVGHGVGETRGRRFAKVLLEMTEPEPYRGISFGSPPEEFRTLPEGYEYGWVSPDLKRVTLLSGLEREFVCVIRYLSPEDVLHDRGPWTPFYVTDSPTDLTPFLLYRSGETRLAAKILHWLTSMTVYGTDYFYILSRLHRMYFSRSGIGSSSQRLANADSLVRIDELMANPRQGHVSQGEIEWAAGLLKESRAKLAKLQADGS